MTLALAALALAFLPPQPDSLALAVAKGSKLTKSSSISFEAGLREASIKVGGRDLPPEVLEKFGMTMSIANEEQVEDEYVSLDGVRPTELVRHYKKASQHEKQHVISPGTKPKEEDDTVESPLLEHAVVFTWDPKAEKYERAYRGEAGEPALLEKLEAGMDFEPILPPGKVEVGETWKLDAKNFKAITSPGGSLSYPQKSKSDSNPLADSMQGAIEARYDGRREVDGRELAVIHLHADVHAAREPDESEPTPMKLEVRLDLQGEYLWDVAQGHLASYELEGPAEFTLSGTREIEAKDQKLPMEMRFELEGSCKIAGKIE